MYKTPQKIDLCFGSKRVFVLLKCERDTFNRRENGFQVLVAANPRAHQGGKGLFGCPKLYQVLTSNSNF